MGEENASKLYDIHAHMWKPQHRANINLFVLPEEPHSRCSTAMSYIQISTKSPVLMTVFFPPFNEADIKLQSENSNRDSTENINILITMIAFMLPDVFPVQTHITYYYYTHHANKTYYFMVFHYSNL